MKLWSKTLLAAALVGSAAYAAPGLTVSGTDLMYNGKKIFFSGTNLAWSDYNSDVGESPLNENAWRKAVEGTRAAGGNSIRWWLFNNMSQSPTIDETTHLVTGPKASTIANMKKALDIAEEYGVMVSMCLFSHNLMEPEQWGLYTGDKVDFEANKLLFEEAGTKAFIDNVLIPVVKAIGNHKALMTWEVFNEPEGMTSECEGWTAQKMALAKIQKFTNEVASAIHTVDPTLLVSTGSVNIKFQKNWNDAALIAAGGKANGTLDFFQTHYYPYYQADAISPFVNTAAQMATTYGYDSKPMIIGEFPASGWAGDTYNAAMAAKTEITTKECYRKAFDGGYAGALAWQYIGDKTEDKFGGYSYTIDPALAAMKTLAATEEASIKIKDVVIEEAGGDGKMAVTFGGGNPQIEYQNKAGWDLSKANTLTMKVKNNGKTEADIYLIFKLTDAWTWTETDGSCKVAAGESKLCSYDISTLTNRNKTVSIVLANYAKDYKGTVLFDDIVAGTDTLFNFNEDKYDAFSRGFGMTEVEIPEIKIVYDENYTNGISKRSAVNAKALHLNGNALSLSFTRSTNVKAILFDATGHKVSTLHNGSISAGTHEFKIQAAKGVYFVKVKGQGIDFSQKIMLK